MTINDQIGDKKLQYDINRKAAEISALSAGKIDKYKYLTGKGILPSNQQQIIEQATFIYSSSGKAFEKQIETIEDQREKQVETLENLKPKEQDAIKYESDDKLSMQKEIYNRLLRGRLNKIQEISKEIDFNNLTYYFKTPGISSIYFIKFNNDLVVLKK